MIKQLITIVTLLISFSIHAAEPTSIIEWAPFEIKEGVSTETLINAAQALEEGFLKQQKGYINRSLLKGERGQWVDIIYWQSEADANAAANLAYESPICLKYFALMKENENAEVSNVLHYKIMKSW